MTEKTYTYEQKKAFERDRWSMQNECAKLLVGTRVSFCLRSPISVKESIKIVEREALKNDEKRFGFTGLQCCGSVHGCCMCASKISLQREQDIRQITDWATKQDGLFVAMLTLTQPHSKYDMLQMQLEKLLGYKDESEKRVRGAVYWFQNSRTFRRLKAVGYIKKFEATYGLNGWHPHHHILLILDAKICGCLDQYKLHLEWVNACKKVGFDEPSLGRGLKFDIAKNPSEISGYIAKMGTWDAAKEMTSDNQKIAKKEGKTQWQLLRDSKDGCKKSGALFLEYFECTKGVRSLTFSRGLKDKALVENISDGKASEDLDAVKRIIFEFVGMQLCIHDKKAVECQGIQLWHVLLSYGSRYELLEIAKNHGSDGVKKYLFKLIADNHLLFDMPYIQPSKIRNLS